MVNISGPLRIQVRDALESVGSKLSSFGSPERTLSNDNISITERCESPGTPKSMDFPLVLSVSDSNLSVLPQPQPQPIDAAFEALIEAFRLVQKALYDLMNNDSFPRYKESEFCNKLEHWTKTPSKKETPPPSKDKENKDSKGSKGSKGSKTRGGSPEAALINDNSHNNKFTSSIHPIEQEPELFTSSSGNDIDLTIHEEMEVQ